MLNFLSANIGTMVVGAVILAVVIAIVGKIVRDKKQGKCTSCDCCSGNCHSSSSCSATPKDTSR